MRVSLTASSSDRLFQATARTGRWVEPSERNTAALFFSGAPSAATRAISTFFRARVGLVKP